MTNYNIKLRKQLKRPIIIFLFLFTIGMNIGVNFGSSQVLEEKDLLNESLERKEITWEIKKAIGIFASNGNHTNDKLKYRVEQVVGTDPKGYLVNVSQFIWSETEFSDYSTAQKSDYYLITRNWKAVANDVFAKEDSEFGWNTTSELINLRTIEFDNELIGGSLINTVNIFWYFNETNYDYIKYTRNEGILLSREISVNITDGIAPGQDLLGKYTVEMVDFSGDLAVSPMTYVIWFIAILVLTFVSISLISYLITKRKQNTKHFNY